MQEKDYIERLQEKCKRINDPELTELVNKLLEERMNLFDQANIDTLTGVHNRRILSNIHQCSSLVICDIDNFKTINDKYGHLTGDKVIKEVANALKNSIRDTDYICRYGGDEFIIIFTDCYDEEVIKKRLKEVQEKIAENLRLGSLQEPVSLSMGMVMNIKTDYLNDIKDLIVKADMALYYSKGNGKNKVTQYEEQTIKANTSVSIK